MPSPIAPGAIAPQLWHLGERRKQVFSISAAGTEGGSESASEERRFRSIACLSAGTGGPGPSWRQTCPGTGGLVPPSCSPLWHPVSLQSRAPLASEMSQFQANKQALQSAKSSGRNHKGISVSCVSLGPPPGRSTNPFKAEAGLSSCWLLGDHLQCCDTVLPVTLPTEPRESQGAGLPLSTAHLS